MLDTRYYEGYEGEGEVKVWSEENGNEDGIVTVSYTHLTLPTTERV